MTDTSVTPAQPPNDLERVRETMERNEVLLSAKTQNMVNQLKTLDSHFYSVGKYKAPDGTWKDKMEPDAFAVQTMATLQAVNTEVLSMTWENPDDLLNAAVTVRVRGWKGSKSKPAIEKTVELRLSMKAITAKYVMDKLEPKKKWNDTSRRKEETPAEWTEDDVTLQDNGWVQPKSFKHQVAMRSFLVDQFSFLGRMAESKAERRINLKLLGFDWRDPDEIDNETAETAAVSATKPETFADHAPLIAKIDVCKTDSELNVLSITLSGEVGKCSPDGQKAVLERMKQHRAALAMASSHTSTKMVNHKDGDQTNSEISNLEIVDGPPAEQAESFRDMFAKKPEMAQDEFQALLESLKAQETTDDVDTLLKATEGHQMSEQQRALLADNAAKAKAGLKKLTKKK